jgi:ABC-type enterochelin transport system ATPase subunit
MRRGQVYKAGPVGEIINSEVIGEFFQKPVNIDRNKDGYYHLSFK